MSDVKCTYTRLKDESWGVRIQGALLKDVKSGMKITVTKKDGERREETIDRVIYSAGDITFVSVVKKDNGNKPKSAPLGAPTAKVCPACGQVIHKGAVDDDF